MMRCYKGKEPCAGCGITGSDKLRRNKFDLCRDCEDLLRLGKKAKAQNEKDLDIYISVYSFQKSMPYLRWEINEDGKRSRVEMCYEHNKGLEYISGAFMELRPGDTDRLNASVNAFLETISNMAANPISTTSMTCEDGHRRIFKIPVAQARAFFEMWKQIAAHEQIVKTKHYERGKNLLIGLANGEMTIKEFNEKS